MRVPFCAGESVAALLYKHTAKPANENHVRAVLISGKKRTMKTNVLLADPGQYVLFFGLCWPACVLMTGGLEAVGEVCPAVRAAKSEHQSMRDGVRRDRTGHQWIDSHL